MRDEINDHPSKLGGYANRISYWFFAFDQGLGIAVLNRPGQRVFFSGMLNPAQHCGAGDQPFPAHIAAGQLAYLERVVDCIRTVSSSAVMDTPRISEVLAIGEPSTSFLGFMIGIVPLKLVLIRDNLESFVNRGKLLVLTWPIGQYLCVLVRISFGGYNRGAADVHTPCA